MIDCVLALHGLFVFNLLDIQVNVSYIYNDLLVVIFLHFGETLIYHVDIPD